MNFVRLACVRHAASVRPEPGSNSLKIVFYAEALKSFLELNRSFTILAIVIFFLVSFPKSGFGSYFQYSNSYQGSFSFVV